MTLDDYRIECAWSQAEMARNAKIDPNTLRRALSGESISANTANKLAHAIGKELRRTIRSQEIDGLNVSS
jgi:transcriptional regulator with XRE-family HTH domain